jgi:hypothetical protein
MTAFSPITGAPALTTSNLQPCPVTLNGISFQNCSAALLFTAGDPINGNSTAFELGTMTIANDGSGPGDVTLWSADAVDAKFTDRNGTMTGPGSLTVPQVLAIAAPEPGTLLLLGVGVGGLVAVRARRPRATWSEPPAGKHKHALERAESRYDASREHALREPHRLFVEIGAMARAEQVAREIGR